MKCGTSNWDFEMMIELEFLKGQQGDSPCSSVCVETSFSVLLTNI